MVARVLHLNASQIQISANKLRVMLNGCGKCLPGSLRVALLGLDNSQQIFKPGVGRKAFECRAEERPRFAQLALFNLLLNLRHSVAIRSGRRLRAKLRRKQRERHKQRE